MLADWRSRPHVTEWWGEGTVDDDEMPFSWIAELDGRPVGYLQGYVVMGEWWPNETDPGARGVDLFLADPELVGSGAGTEMLRQFVARLFADPAVTKVQIDPSPDNARAIRSFEKAGFRRLGEVDTPDGRALLMIVER
jgi:RimJ/RimL family protein N-acetyltransferase